MLFNPIMDNKLNELPNELNSVIASYLKKPTLKQQTDYAIKKYFDFVRNEVKSILMKKLTDEQADFIISGKYANDNEPHQTTIILPAIAYKVSVVIPKLEGYEEQKLLNELCEKIILEYDNEVCLEKICGYDIRVMRGVIKFINKSKYKTKSTIDISDFYTKDIYDDDDDSITDDLISLTRLILNIALEGYYYSTDLEIENLLPREADYYVGKLNISDLYIFEEYHLRSTDNCIHLWSEEEDYEEYTNFIYFSFSRNGRKFFLDIRKTQYGLDYLRKEIDYEGSEVVLEELDTYYYEGDKWKQEEIVVAGGGLSNGNAYAVVYFDMEKKMWRYKEYGKNGFDNSLLGGAVRNIKNEGKNMFAIVSWYK